MKTRAPRQPRQQAPGLRVRRGQYRLPPDVAARVAAGHPWVFRAALGARGLTEGTGELVELIGGNRDFVARGYVDQGHAIAVRIMSLDPGERVHPGAGAVAGRFARAVQRRWLAFGAERPEAMRLFAGDSEGLPGVTVDRFGAFVVVQWLAEGALPWRSELYDAITEVIRPSGLYEQKRFRPLGGEAPPEPAVRAGGEEAPLELVVSEADCRFGVDVTAPLGVGLFPDLRLGRDAVAARAAGRRVLNLFSYTGAFSVRAAKAGAAEVVGVDMAARGHARARRNLELSGLPDRGMETVTGEVGKTLDRFADRGRRFDLVICDPPTFSQTPGGTFSAARDLPALAEACLGVLEPGGFLALATNASKVSAADLDRSLAEGAARARAGLCIIGRIGLPPDYPVAPGFPEGNYLKMVLAMRM